MLLRFGKPCAEICSQLKEEGTHGRLDIKDGEIFGRNFIEKKKKQETIGESILE